MAEYSLALMPGDGIGPEVTAEAVKVLDTAAAKFGFTAKWTSFPFGADYYLQHGHALPAGAMDELADHDAMLLGAVGDPRVKPGPLEQEILLAFRFHFDQYVNLRPAVSFPGIPVPVELSPGGRIDAVVVRENTEDLYMGMGGTGVGYLGVPLEAQRGLYCFSGHVEGEFKPPVESAFSIGLMTRPGIERIARYAFELAKRRGEKQIYSVSKANAVPHLYGFWDKVVRETAEREFPDMSLKSVNVDALCYLLARNPEGWGVILCPNLFGDIVSDLYSGLAGGLGLAAAGNIGDKLSMFEPVHGSAPDIAGSGKANPVAAILSVAMLLDHIGENAAAEGVRLAVGTYLDSADLAKPIEQGGSATTAMVGEAIADLVAQ
ncbi:MAG: isocitrate/isopropylmalate dehydrogenase family protein [Planctomycetes bacterium]|nr:isocitrate/isopropylmalate dehydrogenase family protein [Planctomycetota bacterium]